MLLPSRLNHQFPSHFRMPLCRRLHLVTSLTRCPRRRLFNRTRFRVMWPFRRLSMVPIPYPWRLLRRRPHPVPCLSMSLCRWVLAQLPRFLLIRLCRLLYAVWCYMMLPRNYRSRSSSLAAFTRTVLWTAKPPSMQGSHALPQPPPGLEQPAPPPELAAYSHLLTTHGAYVNSSSNHAQQSPVSTTQVGTHPVRTATSAKRSASTALAGTHNPIGSNLRTDTGLFPKPRAVVLPMVSFGQPKSNRLGPTVISCIINFVFPSFSGIQARRAEILPTSSLPPVVGFMQLSFRKPVTMSRTPPINSGCTPTTWTLLSCSTRTPLSQTLQFSHSRPTPRAKVRGAWYYSSFEACCAARLFLAHLQSHFARYTSTMLWPRNVMHPLSFSNSFMPKCWNTMSTS